MKVKKKYKLIRDSRKPILNFSGYSYQEVEADVFHLFGIDKLPKDWRIKENEIKK
jgi:hypothetical protein